MPESVVPEPEVWVAGLALIAWAALAGWPEVDVALELVVPEPVVWAPELPLLAGAVVADVEFCPAVTA